MSMNLRLGENYTIRETDSPTLLDVADKITELRAQGKTAAARYSDEEAQIRKDDTLNANGIIQKVAEIQTRRRASMSELREQEREVINSAIKKLEVQLDSYTGYGAEALIAFRDAHDRAANISTADAAEKIMTRAIRSNDHTLAAAVYRRAREGGYKNAAQLFENARPAEAQAAHDIDKLTKLRDQFGRGLNYM